MPINIKQASDLSLRFLDELEKPFVGRHEEALIITLALVSGEHAVLIGEPGTAKSAMVRRASELLEARFFKYLLTKFTEPGELFGPLDIKGLREGLYKRVTVGKLPEADIAFLDEIFNANSAVLNSLLSIMQERILYDGYTEIRVPLWSLIGASNRPPEEPELEALYDRFLFRQHVKPLEADNWNKLLDYSWKLEKGEESSVEPVMDMNTLREIHKAVFTIDLSVIKPRLIKLFLVLQEKGLYVTDRRKGKILKAIAAHALLYGREKANEDDLIVLKYTVPKDVEDFDKINVILMEELRTKERVLRELEEIRSNILIARKAVEKVQHFDPRLTEYYRSLKNTRNRIMNLIRDFEDEDVISIADELIEKIDDTLQEIMAKLNM